MPAANSGQEQVSREFQPNPAVVDALSEDAAAGGDAGRRTSFGRISSELPVTSTGSIVGDTLNGTIGSGSCQLQLTDSNGSIEIAKAP